MSGRMGMLSPKKFSSTFLVESIPYAFVVLLTAIMVFNKSFMGSGYLNLGDITLPFLPGKALSDALYMWSTYNFGGYSVSVSLLPYYGFIFLLTSLNIPMVIVSRLLFVISLLLVGVASIFLGKALFNSKFSYMACSILSGFLMVSPALSFLTDSKFIFAYGGMILVLNFLLRGLRYGQHRKYALLAALSSIMMSMQPHVFALSAILIFLFLLIYLPFRRGGHNVFFVFGTLMMSLLFNLYWIVPEGIVYLTHPNVIQTIYMEQSVESWAFPTDALFWRLRLLSFSNAFSDLPIIFAVQFVIIAFGLSYFIIELLRRKRPRIESVPFFIIFFIFLSLYQGVQSPLYMYLWNNFNPFKILRNSTYFVLPISLVFSVLIGFSLEASMQLLDEWRTGLRRIRNILKRFFVSLIPILFVSIVITYGVSGPLLYRGTIDQSLEYRSDMNIPKEYFNLPNLLSDPSDSQYRLLVLPWQEGENLNFTWFPHFKTPDITPSFSPITTVIGGIISNPPIPLREILKFTPEIGGKDAASAIGRLGIKYVLLHHDANGFEQVEKQLRAQFDSSPFFMLKARYNSFSLYSLNDSFVLPRVFTMPQESTNIKKLSLLSFDDGYFESEKQSSLALEPPFTISLWVNQYKFWASNKGAYILSSSSNQTAGAFAFQFFIDNGTPGWSQFLYASPTGYPEVYVYVNSKLQFDSFHHLVGVVANSSIAYYVDGKLAGNTSLPGRPIYVGSPSVYLGGNPKRPETPNFRGIISNVQFYKSALSTSQVKVLFKEGITATPIETANPILHWPIDTKSNETIDKNPMKGKWFGTIRPTYFEKQEEADASNLLLERVPYESLSPVSFSGTLKPGNYTLILNEQFDRSWELRIGNKVIKEHNITFGFANKWPLSVEKGETFSIRQVTNDFNLFLVYLSTGSVFLIFLLLFVFRVKVSSRLFISRRLTGGIGLRIKKSNVMKVLFVILTIIVSSLLVYGNLLFKPNTFLLWSDAPFEFYADEIWGQIQNSWAMDNFGFPSVYRGADAWMGLEWLALKFIPAITANRFLFLLPLFLRGFSMYYLLSTLIRRNDAVSIFCKLIPSVFFIAVPLDLYAFWNNGLSLSFMPLVMAFYIRGAFADRKAVYIGLGAFSSVFLFAHPVFAAFTFAFLIIFTVVLATESNKRAAPLYCLKFLLLTGLFNLLTIVPLLMARQNMSSYFSLISASLSEANLASSADFNRLVYVSRLLTAQPSLPYFSSPLVVLLGFFMVAYSYATVFYIGSRDRMQIYAKWLIISSLLITLFATGVAYPFSGSIYLFFYRTIPGLLANVTYWLYPLSVLYACLIGLTTYLIAEHIRGLNQKSRRVTVLLRKYLAVSLIGIAVLSVVAYNGSVYTNANLGFRGDEATTIPEDYFQLHDFLNKGNVNDYQMLVYPKIDHFVRPTWFDQSFHIVDVVDKFSPVPVFVWRVNSSPSDLMQRALLDLDKGETRDALRVLGMHSIKYIFVHKDIPGISYSGTANTLSSSPGITLVIDSKNYMLFEINESLVVPMMFAVSATDVNATGYISNPGTVIQGFSKGPEEFDLRIPGGKEVILVLNKAYSSDWVLSGDQLQSERIVINGFVNGWRINSAKETVAHVTLESNVWISLGMNLSAVSMITFVVIIAILGLASKLKALRRLPIWR